MGGFLLHICCAPDATVPLEELGGAGGVIGFFYGSNIHPEEEYRRRVEALSLLYRSRGGGPVVVAPYAPAAWFEVMEGRGLLGEPEGGRRCTACFELQIGAAAAEAVRQGCTRLGTSLTISPHKDVERITRIGQTIAAAHGLDWEPRIWRKRGGFLRSVQISKALGLYRQNYCGCLPSRKELPHRHMLK